ncbi:MAG TPA: hypothetical protein VHS97_12750 [Isosphaeraceae bacterium]|nr:hypothetical protein [Isosphaeraceae bacterium]
MLPVQFGQSWFEIVAHQHDRQVGGTLYDANAQLTQGNAEFHRTLNVDRLNADAAFLEVFLGNLRRQTQACPIGGHGANRRRRCREDIAAVDQPLEGFIDFVGWKLLFQLANEVPKALPTFSYCGRDRAIERAVKKKLPVLGIEAHDIGRQHIDGEIRREPRNVFAVTQRKGVLMIACHEVSTRTFIATPPVQGALFARQHSVV